MQLVASLSADPGVASSIPTGSHTFMEIDHEIFFTVMLLLQLIQEVLLLKSKYVQEVLVYGLVKLPEEKVWLGELTIST